MTIKQKKKCWVCGHMFDIEVDENGEITNKSFKMILPKVDDEPEIEIYECPECYKNL